MTSAEVGPGGGYLHLLPTWVPGGMAVTAMSSALLPWLCPGFGAVLGTTQQPQPAAVLAVTYEWPQPWLRTAEPVGRFEREWLYLRRFSMDQLRATGHHAFANVRQGADPPDAMVDTAEHGALGVESTSLTIEARRGVHGLFRQVRTRLLALEPSAFARLAGYLIYVWFQGDDEQQEKPHRRSEADAVERLVRGLAEYEPNPAQLWMPPGPFPDTAPAPPLAQTDSGARFYAMPLQQSMPSTILFTVAGFEMGLAYTTMLTDRAAWEEVQRLVDSHDQPGVDLLLITAGGPDQHGLVFPAEEVLAEFLLAHPLGLSRPPEHIKQVVMHSWMTGRATRLHPTMQHLFGPLYQSLVPETHPVVPQHQVAPPPS